MAVRPRIEANPADRLQRLANWRGCRPAGEGSEERAGAWLSLERGVRAGRPGLRPVFFPLRAVRMAPVRSALPSTGHVQIRPQPAEWG